MDPMIFHLKLQLALVWWNKTSSPRWTGWSDQRQPGATVAALHTSAARLKIQNLADAKEQLQWQRFTGWDADYHLLPDTLMCHRPHAGLAGRTGAPAPGLTDAMFYFGVLTTCPWTGAAVNALSGPSMNTGMWCNSNKCWSHSWNLTIVAAVLVCLNTTWI